MIVAIAENGCDNPDDHMETLIFVLVTIVTIRITTVMDLDRNQFFLDDQVTIENLMETTSAAIVTIAIETISCKVCSFWLCPFPASSTSERTCARESTFSILSRDGNFRVINSFHHRLIFPLMCFSKLYGLLMR